MITEGLLMILISLMNFAYALLPPWDIRANLMDAMLRSGGSWSPASGFVEGTTNRTPLGAAFSTMWQMNKFMPVDHVVAALSVVVVFWAALVGYRFAKWLIGVVRGAGTQ